MAHNSLIPEDDRFLTNEDIVQLLRSEFSYVTTNQELGKREYDRGLAYLRSLLDKGLSPSGRDIKQELALAERKRDSATYVVIADSAEPGDAYLTTTLVPDEAIFFGYCSPAHQTAAHSLVERVKKVLGYQENE